MNPEKTKALVTIAALAAFADGEKSEAERTRFREVLGQLSVDGVDARGIVTEVLLRKVDMASACRPLDTTELRALAYEYAVCLCEADGVTSEPERAFLDSLRRELQMDRVSASSVLADAETVVALPVAAATPAAEVPPSAEAADPNARLNTVDPSPMIMNYAILCAGLELLPQGLANLAILPIQMKMVYRVGLAHGFTLDRGHIVELLGVLGLSATGQMLEGVARKFLGKLGGAVAGGLGKIAVRGVTGAALTFATTYAMGHVAHRYYGGGRRLDQTAMKNLFGELKTKADTLYPQYAEQIKQQSTQINVQDVLRGRNLP